ncbi:helix-turn-helix domain-containing protein [Ensifer canadensis]
MSNLADRIKEAAQAVGGLNKLSELIAVPRRTMGHWLQGRQPKPEALQDIARVTEIDLRWLLTGEGDKHDTALSRALRSLEPGPGADAISSEEAEAAFQKGMARVRRARPEPTTFDQLDDDEIDERLMEDLAKVATSVYRELGQHLPAEKVTVEATRLFNSLRQLIELDDTDGVTLALALLRHKLKKRLERAAAAPGSGKRSA